MKKILFIAVVYFSFILTINPVFAQTISLSPESTMSAKNVLKQPVKKVSYELPYPGILPDSPLYILKAARDRIISFLITDPLKKAEFNLLTSDKRINAGNFLIQKKSDALAISTISKGNNYFDETLNNLQIAKKQGLDISSLLGRTSLSIQKHEEIIKSLEATVTNPYKGELQREYVRAVQFEKSVNKMNGSK